MIRVRIPNHLRTLAGIADREVVLDVDGEPTQRAVLDALEAQYPALRGTVRDRETKQRRAFIRFFACEQDLSHESPDAPLPAEVAAGKEPYLIVGAMAGG
ncbi:MoaD/ThiS family protein [Saccharopolyspora hirsuta]|uniref:MoaD/ThiS family protein n=1 Tax=Saccharopolyspora hirsuta TaxID=1837 RepID=UPI00332D5B19